MSSPSSSKPNKVGAAQSQAAPTTPPTKIYKTFKERLQACNPGDPIPIINFNAPAETTTALESRKYSSNASQFKAVNPEAYAIAIELLSAGVPKTRISKLLQTSIETIQAIARNEGETINDQKELISDNLLTASTAIAERLLLAITNDEISPQHLHTTLNSLINNSQLLKGQATSITRHQKEMSIDDFNSYIDNLPQAEPTDSPDPSTPATTQLSSATPPPQLSSAHPVSNNSYTTSQAVSAPTPTPTPTTVPATVPAPTGSYPTANHGTGLGLPAEQEQQIRDSGSIPSPMATSDTQSGTQCHQQGQIRTNTGITTDLDTADTAEPQSDQGRGGHETEELGNSQPVQGVGSGVVSKAVGASGDVSGTVGGLPGDVDDGGLRAGMSKLQKGSNRGATASNRGDRGVGGMKTPTEGEATRVEPQSGNKEEMYWPGGD
jgi:hypothetical protein